MASDRSRAPITPATKVADLLESWPELEEVLIAQAPAFRRLRNPVLRRTVARVASLEQAAGVGGVPVRELVAALRRAAGLEVAALGDAGSRDDAGPQAPPEWLDPRRVAETLDAEALLDAGEVPLTRVGARARALGPGALLRIESGFRPVPLVEALARLGYRCFVRENAPGRFETFVVAPSDDQKPDETPDAPGPLRRFFSADHRRLDGLLRRSIGGLGPIDLALFGAFRAGLLRHIGMEEKVLFTAAREARGGVPLPLAERLRVDHGAIASLLVPTPTRALVAELLSVLGPHNGREEEAGGVYDACDQALGRAAAERLVEELREFPDPPLKPYNDGPEVMRHIEANLELARRQWVESDAGER